MKASTYFLIILITVLLAPPSALADDIVRLTNHLSNTFGSRQFRAISKKGSFFGIKSSTSIDFRTETGRKNRIDHLILRFKNSWGTNWKDGGYGEMTYKHYLKYGRGDIVTKYKASNGRRIRKIGDQ